MTESFRYSIITPDGQTFDLGPPSYSVQIEFPEGAGLPPIEHYTQDIANGPGQSLRGIKVLSRPVTILVTVNGGCRSNLHELRKALWNALRWNRTTDDPPLPSTLRYTCNEVSTDLNVYLLDPAWGMATYQDKAGEASIRLIAYDPLWYGAEQTDNFSVVQSVAMSYIAAKIDRAWSALGNVGTGGVLAIAFSIDGTKMYIGGGFANWAGIASADNIAQYDFTTSTWSALGTGIAAPATVYDLLVAPDGSLYVIGNFASAGGVAGTAHIARWDGATWFPLGTGLDDQGTALAYDPVSNSIYAGGTFTLAGGVANTVRIAKWNGTAWSALDTGCDGNVSDIVVDPLGNLYVTGAFANAGGVACAKIAKWDGSAFTPLSTGLTGGTPIGYTLALGMNGMLYVGGDFTTAGGVSASNIAKWNGAIFSGLGDGVNDYVMSLAIDPSGLLYAGGTFTTAGGLALGDRIACWNGTAWSHLDIDLPGAPEVSEITFNGNDMYLGFSTTGNAITSALTTLTTSGDVDAYPAITITGPGTLQWIENIDSGKKMILNCFINAGETVTIDLSPGVKSIASDWRGNLLPYATVLPLSDFATFALSPDPIAPDGVNTIDVLMTGTTPVEQNDGSNQLSNWANITGVTPDNTDSGGKMYVSILPDGGGFYHIELFKDSAKATADRVGYTASYNGAGAKTIQPINSSGLGGTVTVDAVTAMDTDILVLFATGKITWQDVYLSADKAVE